MKEIWKEIPYNPNYSISNYGRVINNRTKNVLKPMYNKYTGYICYIINRKRWAHVE